jgi:hypothetical protein
MREYLRDSAEDVRGYFSQFGEVKEVSLTYDRVTHRSRGKGNIYIYTYIYIHMSCYYHELFIHACMHECMNACRLWLRDLCDCSPGPEGHRGPHDGQQEGGGYI